MDNKPTYGGGLTREQFLAFECKVVAKLMLEDKNYQEIENEIREDNLFQLPTLKSVKDIGRACYKRLSFVNDKRLLELVANGGSMVSRFAILYCMACQNLVVRDYLTEVIGPKYKSRTIGFDKTDVNHYLSDLATKVESVNGWSEGTAKKINAVLVKILVESGYLTTIKSKELNPISVDDELLMIIKDRGDYDLLPAFNEIGD